MMPQRVGVSTATLDGRSVPAREGILYVPWDGLHGAEILWRRSGDRTADLVAAAARGSTVRWVHLDTVGVDRLPLAEWRERGIRVSNGRGLGTIQVAEWALGAMLLAVRRLDETVRLSDAGRWEAPAALIRTLHGRHVVVLGLGAIGTRVAYLAGAFGARVTGIVSSEPGPDDPRRLAVESLLSVDRLAEACSDAGLLVLCAPVTQRTRSIVSAEILHRLPDSAWIVNASRGELIDERALAEEVDAGRLGGAVLDVASQEPPPADSPLRRSRGIVLSAHVADHPRADDCQSGLLFMSQLDSYVRQATMHNEVDLTRGY